MRFRNKGEFTGSEKALFILNILALSGFKKDMFYISYRNLKFHYEVLDVKGLFNDLDNIIRSSEYFK